MSGAIAAGAILGTFVAATLATEIWSDSSLLAYAAICVAGWLLGAALGRIAFSD